jgi:hypothetical protein
MAYARTWCKGDETCRPVRFRGAYANAEDCASREAALCETTRFGEGSLFSTEQLLACATASDLSSVAGEVSVQCEKWLGWELGRSPPLECRVKGRLPDGAACLDGNQCERGTCRGGVPRSQICGTCNEMLQLDDACATDAECEAPYVCVDTLGAPGQRHCAKVGGLDAACAADAPCRPYLTCVEGQCKGLLPAGEACVPGGCAPWEALACGSKSTCVQVSEGKQENARCSETEACALGLVCRVGATGSTRACVPAIHDGKVCTLIETYLTGPCTPPAICVSGGIATSARCEIPDPAACNPVLPP